MISPAWIASCSKFPMSILFSREKPRKILDPDLMYMEMGEIPMESVDRDEVLRELYKLGWSGNNKLLLCPACSRGLSDERG